jgi:hypothetical protein
MEPAAECMLVLIGATPEGKKELVGFQTGVRESAQSWRELLIDIKQRSLGARAPALIPYAKNARTHTDAQVAAIAASIKEWGWTTPALVGEDGGLIAGHARILAARQLGIAEIPVMVAAGWSGAPPCGQPACAGQSQRRHGWGELPCMQR